MNRFNLSFLFVAVLSFVPTANAEKLIVSPTISSSQRRVLEMSLQIARNQQNIIGIYGTLALTLSNSSEAVQCAQSKTAACVHLTKLTNEVLGKTLNQVIKAANGGAERIDEFTRSLPPASKDEANDYQSALTAVDHKRIEFIETIKGYYANALTSNLMGGAVIAGHSAGELVDAQRALEMAQTQLDLFIQFSRVSAAGQVSWHQGVMKGFDKIATRSQ